MTEEESWVEKWRPDNFSEIQGNNKDVKAIKQWAENWSEGDSPQLLSGPPGTGKTSTAQVTASHMGWPITEVNASSSRTSDDILDIAAAMSTSPVDADQHLVLLDEIDSLDSAANLSPLKKALSDPHSPIVLTANDSYSVPKTLKRECTEREFSLQKRSRKAKLKDIRDAENVDISNQDLGKLSTRPDLRSAINDLQMYASHEDAEVGWDERSWSQGEFDAIDNILDGEGYVNFDATPADFIWWLDENWRADASELGKNVRGLEAVVVYDCLSRADKFLERAEKQDYRFWSVANALLKATQEARLSKPYEGWVQQDFPSYFRWSTDKHTDGSPEANLYQRLSEVDKNNFALSGNYTYFKQILLPLLKDLPEEDREEIAFNAGCEDEELKALGLEPDSIEEKRATNWVEGQGETNSALKW